MIVIMLDGNVQKDILTEENNGMKLFFRHDLFIIYF